MLQAAITLSLFHTFYNSLQHAHLLGQQCLHQSSPSTPFASEFTFFPTDICPSTLQIVHWTEPSTLDWTKLLLALTCKTSARTALKMFLPTSSQINVTADGHSDNLSWCQTPIWCPWSDFNTVKQLRVCWCGAASLTRGRVCSLQWLSGLASAVIHGSKLRGTQDHILLTEIWDSLNLEG